MTETPNPNPRGYTQKDVEDWIFAQSAKLAGLDNVRLELLAMAVLHQFIIRFGAEWTRAWLRDESRQVADVIVSRPAPPARDS